MTISSKESVIVFSEDRREPYSERDALQGKGACHFVHVFVSRVSVPEVSDVPEWGPIREKNSDQQVQSLLAILHAVT
jgi:hypothetical protein